MKASDHGVEKPEPPPPGHSGIPVAMPVFGAESPGAVAFATPVMGIPMTAPPAYATVAAPMVEEDVPEGAARYPWQGPGREYDSGILRQIAGCGSWRNPYEWDKVNVNVSSMANGTRAMIVDRGEPQYFETEVPRFCTAVPYTAQSSAWCSSAWSEPNVAPSGLAGTVGRDRLRHEERSATECLHHVRLGEFEPPQLPAQLGPRGVIQTRRLGLGHAK